MPRFFFNLRDSSVLMPDEDGLELPGVAAALVEARQSGLEMLAEALKTKREVGAMQIEVLDEARTMIYVFNIRDLLN